MRAEEGLSSGSGEAPPEEGAARLPPQRDQSQKSNDASHHRDKPSRENEPPLLSLHSDVCALLARILLSSARSNPRIYR